MEQWADVLETEPISGPLLSAAQALIITFVTYSKTSCGMHKMGVSMQLVCSASLKYNIH